MGKCINHPDRETSYMCMKHQTYLCEECLKCRDPGIYCKFRSSCPIWFMDKRQKGLDDDRKKEAAAETYQVIFYPDEKSSNVAAGTTLLEAAKSAGVHVNASCNGNGVCGKCKLIVESGNTEVSPTPLLAENEKAKGIVLACQTTVKSDLKVRIPEENLERRLKIAGMGREAAKALESLVAPIDPMLKEIVLEMPPPSRDDSVSDLSRILRELKKKGLDVDRLNIGIKAVRQIAKAVREENWQVTASVIQRKCSSEILEILPGRTKEPSLGAAIDVGTTTIVVYLVNMETGAILAATSGHNRQAECGDDVINRIICAEKKGVEKLAGMALATINSLIGEALDSVGADFRRIKNIVVSGNTTMAHLLLKIEPGYIRREPYIPTISEFPILKAGEIGIKAHPGAAVFIMPGPASYVGGDIVSGVLFAGFYREEPLTLFIDVGTNGEIVLGNNEWLMTAACSAGPAFEGGGIRWGMRAEEGAIEKITIDRDTLEPSFTTVGEFPARGICGSGMIDLIAEMLEKGIVDRSGEFILKKPHERIRKVNDEWAYILDYAKNTAIGEDIVFTASDLKNLIYSKGAVFAGFSTLLKEAGLKFSDLDRMIITGGFGQYLNMEKAVRIGLLPDIDPHRFVYLGNSSIAGAYMALLSNKYRRKAGEICNNMTYVDFSGSNNFMDEFTSAMFLPHTNLELFPSVVKSE